MRDAILIALLLVISCFAFAQAKKKRTTGDAAREAMSAMEKCDYSSAAGYGSSIGSCVNGKWVVNEEATKAMREEQYKEQKHRRDLVWALRSRPISDSEMKEVADYGSYLLVEVGESYRQEEIDRRFNDLLLQQFRLRAARDCKEVK